ncbi:UNVERIFIED_CONTAM: hypothetical protein Scaly_2561200 [Sesamum calycinum]|uniref:Uncharacterized protein n=1 Tax=Sesamum calycinum TaxID=2727403 RepID=A0AAW2KL27_9LAMI
MFQKGMGLKFLNRDAAAEGNVGESGDVGGPREELSFLFNSLPTLETAQPEVGSSGWKSTARRVVSGKGSRQNGSTTSGKRLALRAGHGGPSSEPVGCRRTARAAPAAARAGRRVPAGDRLGTAPSGAFPGIEQSTQDCALNVKVKKFNQAWRNHNQGNGLVESAGKEDPVELDSSPTL